MKTLKNEQKSSSNYPSSNYSFKKLSHYFHPDDDFREDHSWGEKSSVRVTGRSARSLGYGAKRLN
ncbi:MAG: hypothetical protein H7223_01205 [Pedobacter sp.]|nr:hypothetical protein [Pedobacter sp.]